MVLQASQFLTDEAVIKHLLDNSDAKLVDLPNNELLYKGKDNLGIHLFPHLFPGEGHYICLISKPGKSDLTDTKEANSYRKLLPTELSNFHINNFNNVLYGLNKNIKYKK